jgi:hypothetical protein
MVYCGKASQNCQNCRTRRIKVRIYTSLTPQLSIPRAAYPARLLHLHAPFARMERPGPSSADGELPFGTAFRCVTRQLSAALDIKNDTQPAGWPRLLAVQNELLTRTSATKSAHNAHSAFASANDVPDTGTSSR